MRYGQQDPDAARPLDRRFSHGERLLMLATLEDGIRTILAATGRSVPRKRLEAELDWLTSDDPRPVFGFVSLCDFLGIDAAYLRARVLASCPPEVDRGLAAVLQIRVREHRSPTS
jgi:hypothetical protein